MPPSSIHECLDSIERDLRFLVECLSLDKMVREYRNPLRNPHEWPAVIGELRLGGLLAAQGASLEPHVRLTSGRSFDFRASVGNDVLNVEVKTVTDEFPMYVSKEYEQSLRAALDIPCGVAVSFRDLPSSATVNLLARLINGLSQHCDVTNGHLTHHGVTYTVVDRSILFPDTDVVHSVRFQPVEQPNSLTVISGNLRSGIDLDLMPRLGLRPEPYEKNPLHRKLRDVIVKAADQLPEDGQNAVCLVSMASEFAESVFSAVVGEPLPIHDVRAGTFTDKLLPTGIALDPVYSGVAARLDCVVCLSLRSWADPPQVQVFKVKNDGMPVNHIAHLLMSQ
jgi:hypothetical protein